jgi:hypothetical protein
MLYTYNMNKSNSIFSRNIHTYLFYWCFLYGKSRLCIPVDIQLEYLQLCILVTQNYSVCKYSSHTFLEYLKFFYFSLILECPHYSLKSLLIYSIYKQPPALWRKLVWFLCISLVYQTRQSGYVMTNGTIPSMEHAVMWPYLRVIMHRLHCSHRLIGQWPWSGLISHFGSQHTTFSCIR